MIVGFFIAAFLFQRKSEDANYSALIWLPPYIYFKFMYRVTHTGCDFSDDLKLFNSREFECVFGLHL